MCMCVLSMYIYMYIYVRLHDVTQMQQTGSLYDAPCREPMLMVDALTIRARENESSSYGILFMPSAS